MNYNPILEHLGPEIENYPTNIQIMFEQMGELMERIRRMILDYNVWASTQPNRLDCISLLRDMRIQPGYRPDSERTYNPNVSYGPKSQVVDRQSITASTKVKVVPMDDLKYNVVNYWENDEFYIAPATSENIAKAKAQGTWYPEPILALPA